MQLLAASTDQHCMIHTIRQRRLISSAHLFCIVDFNIVWNWHIMRWQYLLSTLLTHFILFFTEMLSIKVSNECTKNWIGGYNIDIFVLGNYLPHLMRESLYCPLQLKLLERRVGFLQWLSWLQLRAPILGRVAGNCCQYSDHLESCELLWLPFTNSV